MEAAAYAGWLTVQRGRERDGLRILRGALDQAGSMGRVPLEARARLLLSRVFIDSGRAGDAVQALSDVPLDRLGPELRAKVHHWRARALGEAGDRDAARVEAEAVGEALEQLLRGVPDAFRAAMQSRGDIAELLPETGSV